MRNRHRVFVKMESHQVIYAVEVAHKHILQAERSARTERAPSSGEFHDANSSYELRFHYRDFIGGDGNGFGTLSVVGCRESICTGYIGGESGLSQFFCLLAVGIADGCFGGDVHATLLHSESYGAFSVGIYGCLVVSQLYGKRCFRVVRSAGAGAQPAACRYK